MIDPAAAGGPAIVGARVWLLRWVDEPTPDQVQHWAAQLGPGERARCRRIGTERGRTRFLASHVALRRLASATMLANVSMSHTRWGVAVAAATRPVGIDLEADVERPQWRAAAAARWPGEAARPSWEHFLRDWVVAEAAEKAGAAGAVGAAQLVRVAAMASGPAHVLAVVVGV